MDSVHKAYSMCVCVIRAGPGPEARRAGEDPPRDLDERTTRHQHSHSKSQQILLKQQ